MKPPQRFLPVGESALGTNQISGYYDLRIFLAFTNSHAGLVFQVYSLSIFKG